jgi:hypothetical protein
MLSAGSGDLWFKSPVGADFVFTYTAVGAGFSKGSKLNLTYSTRENWSAGEIYLLDTFSGSELTAADFGGICLIQDASIGFAGGASGDIMFLGISIASLPLEVVKLGFLPLPLDLPNPGSILSPFGAQSWRDHLDLNAVFGGAKAAVLMAGFNTGYQLQIGMSASIGVVTAISETFESWVRRLAAEVRLSTGRPQR